MFLSEQELFYHCVICYAKSLSHCFYCCSLLLFVLISSCTPSGILFDCLLCVLLSSGIVVFLSIILTVCLIGIIGESTLSGDVHFALHCTCWVIIDPYHWN